MNSIKCVVSNDKTKICKGGVSQSTDKTAQREEKAIECRTTPKKPFLPAWEQNLLLQEQLS